ncbi:MAG: sigma-70 family RNA polymerase sigma factor [Calditrichia bacterium]
MKTEVNKQQDLKIVERILKGDEKAYNELVEKYSGLIFSIVYKLIGNKADAEDLAQEIWLKIYKGLGSYNGEFALTTWIMKIASNHTIDFLRKKKLKTTSIHGEDSKDQNQRIPQFESKTFTPEEDLLQTERIKMIEKAIDDLPEKYKQIIILRHREEKDYNEIAEIMNIPLGTVKARLFRAREILNQKLKDVIR